MNENAGNEDGRLHNSKLQERISKGRSINRHRGMPQDEGQYVNPVQRSCGSKEQSASQTEANPYPFSVITKKDWGEGKGKAE